MKSIRKWNHILKKMTQSFTKDTPYLTLKVELEGVNCEDLVENWSRYNGTALNFTVSSPWYAMLCNREQLGFGMRKHILVFYPAITLHHIVASCQTFWINSLVPGRSECNSKNVIFSHVLLIGVFRSSHDNALWWMPQDLTDNKSTLVQVMAWCRQAASHYLGQCGLSFLSPYGITRPQWVNVIWPNRITQKHW